MLSSGLHRVVSVSVSVVLSEFVSLTASGWKLFPSLADLTDAV